MRLKCADCEADPWMFSARPSSPAARKRYFLINSAMLAGVIAAEAAVPAALKASAAESLRLPGTWIGAVYVMKECIAA